VTTAGTAAVIPSGGFAAAQEIGGPKATTYQPSTSQRLRRLVFLPRICYTAPAVKPPPTTVASDAFAPTEWSTILAAGKSQIDPAGAAAALA